MIVFITIGESKYSENSLVIDEMYCRVSSTMEIAKTKCVVGVTWEDDDNEYTYSSWSQVGENLWERVVIMAEEVDG